MPNHVPQLSSAPPRPLATTASSNTALPGWQQLTDEVRQPLVALLTQMLQQHLPVPKDADVREVTDDGC
jgi:hypothetical protein